MLIRVFFTDIPYDIESGIPLTRVFFFPISLTMLILGYFPDSVVFPPIPYHFATGISWIRVIFTDIPYDVALGISWTRGVFS